MDQHESHHEVIYVHSALLFYTVVFSEIFYIMFWYMWCCKCILGSRFYLLSVV